MVDTATHTLYTTNFIKVRQAFHVTSSNSI